MYFGVIQPSVVSGGLSNVCISLKGGSSKSFFSSLRYVGKSCVAVWLANSFFTSSSDGSFFFRGEFVLRGRGHDLGRGLDCSQSQLLVWQPAAAPCQPIQPTPTLLNSSQPFDLFLMSPMVTPASSHSPRQTNTPSSKKDSAAKYQNAALRDSQSQIGRRT